jgi:hypothetical protein
MSVELSGVKTILLLQELVRRMFNWRKRNNVSLCSYRTIAGQYGVDSSDDSLVSRFFLEEVPSLSKEEQDLIEIQLNNHDRKEKNRFSDC